MFSVNTIVSNLLLGIIILLFYQKIINTKLDRIMPVLASSLLFAAVMFLSSGYVIEPLRTIAGIASLGTFYWAWQRSMNWAALILVFVFGFCVRIVSASVSAVFGISLGFYDTELFFILVICVDMLVYFIAYKFIRLKNGIPVIHDKEFKCIVFSLTGIILIYFGGYHMNLTRLQETNYPLFYTSIAALALVILTLTVLTIYFIKKHRERLAFQSQVKELDNQLDELSSEQHKHRGTISAVGVSYDSIVDELNALKVDDSRDKNARLGQLKRRLEAVNQFAVEMGDEFAMDDIKGTVSLPDEWYPLQVLLEQSAKECVHKQILFAVQNKAKGWGNLPVSKVKFAILVGNLVSNAVKELDKTVVKSKQIAVKFYDTDGVFRFDIIDNAHEFPIEVLARLGERGNSTNGTGNGYVEVLEFLNESKASFSIEEWQYGESGKCKMISVMLDGKARLVVRTGYRYDELQTALSDTRFEVERLG